MLTKHLAQSWTRNNLYTYFASEKTDHQPGLEMIGLAQAPCFIVVAREIVNLANLDSTCLAESRLNPTSLND